MKTYKNREYITGGEEPAADTSGGYENIVMQEKLEETRRRHQPAHSNKKPRSDATRRTNAVLMLIVVVLLAVSVTALFVSFLQPLKNQTSSSQDTQTFSSAPVMENEVERKKASQLIAYLQEELENLTTRLEALSVTCEGLGFSVAEINTSVQTVKGKMDENSQNLSRYHPQGFICRSNEYRWNPYSNTCYRVVKVSKNWADARDYCTASGEYLATFVTTDSVEWFASKRSADAWGVGERILWVGGYKYSSGWKWTGSATVHFDSELWAQGQPNAQGDCVHSDTPYNKFANYYCRFSRYFVCETA